MGSGVASDAPLPSFGWMVAVNLVTGGLFGIAILYAMSHLYAWLGRRWGGRAGAREIRTVLAWASVPHIPILAISILILWIGGSGFILAAPPSVAPLFRHPLVPVHQLITLMFVLWSIVIAVIGFQVVMGFSALRAFILFVFGGLAPMVTILLVAVAIGLTLRWAA